MSAAAAASPPAPAERRARLRELAVLFLRLGALGFGGPAAHVAMMEDEVVRRRAWVSREDFLDLVAATNLIPGPNSTELAIHLGLLRAGLPGLFVAGACFIAPAALIVSGLAFAYVTWGALPAAAGLLAGVKPVVAAVVAQALWGFGRSALRRPAAWAVAAGAAAAALAGVNELALLGLAGLAAVALRSRPPAGIAAGLVLPAGGGPGVLALGAGAAGAAAGTVAGTAVAAPTLGGIFLVFAKIGSVLFGSGYVLLAFLQAELVDRLGWLSRPQLLDAIAVGQVTPGPLFTSATFVGWILAGPGGAAAATLGIFLPAFFFVAISGPLLPRLRASAVAGAFLDGIVWSSLALMAVVSARLARDAVTGPWSAALALAAAVALVRFRVNSAWLVLAGALLGLVGRG